MDCTAYEPLINTTAYSIAAICTCIVLSVVITIALLHYYTKKNLLNLFTYICLFIVIFINFAFVLLLSVDVSRYATLATGDQAGIFYLLKIILSNNAAHPCTKPMKLELINFANFAHSALLTQIVIQHVLLRKQYVFLLTADT